MTPQEWILAAFVFALGCCIGSFLNVVIYRLPREKSLVSPGSACPHCGKPIRFYDNIPLVSWIVLRAKCRNCKAPISARYFIVELLTGSVFLSLYIIYFHMSLRPVLHDLDGAWLIYALHLILLSAFIAASGIDLELWIIPLSICWLVTAAGLIGSAVGGLHHPPTGARGVQAVAAGLRQDGRPCPWRGGRAWDQRTVAQDRPAQEELRVRLARGA